MDTQGTEQKVSTVERFAVALNPSNGPVHYRGVHCREVSTMGFTVPAGNRWTASANKESGFTINVLRDVLKN